MTPHMKTRKIRSDAKIHTIPKEVQDQMYLWGEAGISLKEIQLRISNLGFSMAVGSISPFLSKRRSESIQFPHGKPSAPIVPAELGEKLPKDLMDRYWHLAFICLESLNTKDIKGGKSTIIRMLFESVGWSLFQAQFEQAFDRAYGRWVRNGRTGNKVQPKPPVTPINLLAAMGGILNDPGKD